MDGRENNVEREELGENGFWEWLEEYMKSKNLCKKSSSSP
jgi:hypothetical protein